MTGWGDGGGEGVNAEGDDSNIRQGVGTSHDHNAILESSTAILIFFNFNLVY